MAEVSWVTEQIEACACVCCHSDEVSTDGSAGWSIEAGPLWIDTIDDYGVAMFAGLVDSTAFGAFAPEDNNGFDRNTTGVPTTDVERMRAFFTQEYERRGNVAEEAADTYPPFGGPLYQQLEYKPEPCENGEGIAADGTVVWQGGQARYLYILETDSDNPGVPPNLDLPEGTLWRLDVDREAAALSSGSLRVGESPQGSFQRFPEAGTPQGITPGNDYYLYVLADIGIPITRCTFSWEN